MTEHFEHCYIHEGHLCSCGAAALERDARTTVRKRSPYDVPYRNRGKSECLHDWTYMDGSRYCRCGAKEPVETRGKSECCNPPCEEGFTCDLHI